MEKLWESIKNLSDFDVDRNRRRDCTGKRERISVNNSDGRSAIVYRNGVKSPCKIVFPFLVKGVIFQLSFVCFCRRFCVIVFVLSSRFRVVCFY